MWHINEDGQLKDTVKKIKSVLVHEKKAELQDINVQTKKAPVNCL